MDLKSQIDQCLKKKQFSQLIPLVENICQDVLPFNESKSVVSDLTKKLVSSDIGNRSMVDSIYPIVELLCKKQNFYEAEIITLIRFFSTIPSVKTNHNLIAKIYLEVKVDQCSEILKTPDDIISFELEPIYAYLACGDYYNAYKILQSCNKYYRNLQSTHNRLAFESANGECFYFHRKFIESASLFYRVSQAQTNDIYDAFHNYQPNATPEQLKNHIIQHCVYSLFLSPVSVHKERLVRNVSSICPSTITGFEQLMKLKRYQPFNAHDEHIILQNLLPMSTENDQEGQILLHNAIIEHNIASISKIYKSISFKKFSSFLEIDINQLALKVQEMIATGKLSGIIDQSYGYVIFQIDNESDITKPIVNLCEDINSLYNEISPILQK